MDTASLCFCFRLHVSNPFQYSMQNNWGLHNGRARASRMLHHAQEGGRVEGRSSFITLNPAFRSVFAGLVTAAACHVTRKTISERPEHVTGEERVGASAVVAARLRLQRHITPSNTIARYTNNAHGAAPAASSAGRRARWRRCT